MSRPIALRAAKEAIDNVGVQEVGDNRGKAVEIYQASTIPPVPPGSPWCAAFVVYRLRNAAHDLALRKSSIHKADHMIRLLGKK